MATTLDKPQGPPSAPPQAPAPPPVEPLLVQCASCGSPIAFDQTYCVECGAKNDRPDGWLSRFKTRRYVLGGLAVLLAIGGIVGYAVAAASRHDAVKVATKSVPATPPTNQGPATTPPPPVAPPTNTPAPAAPKPATPPPAAGKPTPAAPPSHPSTPSPSTPAPGGSSTPTTTTPHHAQPSTPPAAKNEPAYTKLFTSGRNPVSAGAFDPNHVGGTNGNSLSKVFDNDSSTVWKSGAYASGIGSGVGFYVDNGAPDTIRGLGLLTKTSGFDAQVYGYNGDTPPSALSGWTLLGEHQNVSQRQKITFDSKGQKYQLYLVWFTKMPAKGQRFEIPEVQILP